jgi:2-desacetyl-2-hydroxyethyl bacteriochlorophyllide A dehydrogenase
MENAYPMATVPAPGSIEFVDFPVAAPSPTQVLIKTKAVSICGSDIHTYRGTHPFAPLPAAIGHELSGEIVEIGREVSKFQPGDRVVLEPVIVCGACVFCRQGDYNLCANISFHHREGKGAFIPYFVADQDWVHKLPNGVSFEEGALVEPLAVALHALKRAHMKPGQNVAVFGAGPVGIMIVMVVRRAGAGDIFSVDIQDFRLRKAKEHGATEVLDNAEGDAPEAIAQMTDHLGVDVAFEVVGMQLTLIQSLRALRKGGTAVIVGLFSEPDVVIPSNIFVQKEITLSGSQGYCRDFQAALKLLEEGDIDLGSLITHRLPISSLQKGFHLLTDPDAETMKVVITFD